MIFRFNEWKGNNLAVLLCYFYLFNINNFQSFNIFLLNFAFLFLLFVFIGFLGYYYNDICDVQSDTLAGKRNFAKSHSISKRYLIVSILCLFPFITWYFLSQNQFVLFLLLFEYFLIFSYSSHTIRLKEHPVLSIFNDSLAAQVNLGLIAFVTVYEKMLEINYTYLIIFLSWIFIQGCKYITGHHLKDHNNDLLTQTNTSATKYGFQTILLLNKVILPIVEIVLFTCFLTLTEPLLSVTFVLYLLFIFTRIHIADYLTNTYNPMQDLGYRILNLFYIRYLPIIVLALLSFISPLFLLVLLFHVLFFHENTMGLLNELNIVRLIKTVLSTIVNYSLFYTCLLFGINLKTADPHLSFSEKLLQIKNAKIRKPYDYDLPKWLNEFILNFDEIINDWNLYKNQFDMGMQIDELSVDQQQLNEDKKWKSLFLYGYSYYNQKELKHFDLLNKLIKKHNKHINLVMFSTTESGKHIPAHHGNNHSVLRIQLGIDIKNPESCFLRVEDKKVFLKEKEYFIFDDTFEHELVNASNTHRTVLIIDYFKPLPMCYRSINKNKVLKMQKTAYVQSVIQKFN